MKPRDHRLVGQAQASIVNQEIIRARTIIAELKLNIEMADELRHTARNLITDAQLMLEKIHWRRQRNLTNH